jgi:hypothetical protein
MIKSSFAYLSWILGKLIVNHLCLKQKMTFSVDGIHCEPSLWFYFLSFSFSVCFLHLTILYQYKMQKLKRELGLSFFTEEKYRWFLILMRSFIDIFSQWEIIEWSWIWKDWKSMMKLWKSLRGNPFCFMILQWFSYSL